MARKKKVPEFVQYAVTVDHDGVKYTCTVELPGSVQWGLMQFDAKGKLADPEHGPHQVRDILAKWPHSVFVPMRSHKNGVAQHEWLAALKEPKYPALRQSDQEQGHLVMFADPNDAVQFKLTLDHS